MTLDKISWCEKYNTLVNSSKVGFARSLRGRPILCTEKNGKLEIDWDEVCEHELNHT